MGDDANEALSFATEITERNREKKARDQKFGDITPSTEDQDDGDYNQLEDYEQQDGQASSTIEQEVQYGDEYFDSLFNEDPDWTDDDYYDEEEYE